jgi:hypothetical protein
MTEAVEVWEVEAYVREIFVSVATGHARCGC